MQRAAAKPGRLGSVPYTLPVRPLSQMGCLEYRYVVVCI